ncbi:hypothetical protein ES703_101215 [subsurface metagenome]
MFSNRIAEVFKEKIIFPVGQHGSMIVCPAKTIGHTRVLTVCSHYLYVMHSHSKGKLPVMVVNIAKRISGIEN